MNCAFADTLDEQLLDKGINYLYNYEFDSSLIYLDSTIIINPKHPVPYFVKIANKWLYTQINIGYDSSYQVIYNEIDKVIPIYNNFIELYPDSAEYYLYLGSSYGLKARVDLAKKNWLGVIWSGYYGFDNIKHAQKLNPNLNDIYMPLGVMEYFSSISSKPIQWVSSALGINPDKNSAINHLIFASEKSKYSWIESNTILIYSYLYFENELLKASTLSKQMYEQFPGHPYFIYLYAESLIRLNRITQFETLILKLKNKKDNYPKIQERECSNKFNYLMALYYFRKNDYTNSLIYCNEVTDNYFMEMDWLLGYNFLLMGKIFDLNSDRENAIIYYEKILSMDNLFIYKEWAENYIETSYFTQEKDPLFIIK